MVTVCSCCGSKGFQLVTNGCAFCQGNPDAIFLPGDYKEETAVPCVTCGAMSCYHCQDCGELCWEHKVGCIADPNQSKYTDRETKND